MQSILKILSPSPDIFIFNNDQYKNYVDFEHEKSNEVINILKLYFNEINIIKTKFNNILERILYYFDIACRSCITAGVYSLRDKTGDFFVYQLSGAFYESSESHIKNVYIGQLIRFISLKQTNYTYNGVIIKRPKVVILRDAHTTNIAFNDTKWIKQFMNTSTNYYVLGGNNYFRDWHNHAKCSNTNDFIKTSFYAGYCNFINKTELESIIDDNEWINTLGKGFILNSNDKHQLEDFSYGIDEYLLTNFLRYKESTKKLFFYLSSFFLIKDMIIQ
jgi:hypothetical protein